MKAVFAQLGDRVRRQSTSLAAGRGEGDHDTACRPAIQRAARRRSAANRADISWPQRVAEDLADLGEEQPQVVVDLGGGADGRAARLAGVLVRHGDGRRNAVDPLGGRLFQPFEKLPRVGREALDVAPLPFGIERVEGQARLAAAASGRRRRSAGDAADRGRRCLRLCTSTPRSEMVRPPEPITRRSPLPSDVHRTLASPGHNNPTCHHIVARSQQPAAAEEIALDESVTPGVT